MAERSVGPSPRAYLAGAGDRRARADRARAALASAQPRTAAQRGTRRLPALRAVHAARRRHAAAHPRPVMTAADPLDRREPRQLLAQPEARDARLQQLGACLARAWPPLCVRVPAPRLRASDHGATLLPVSVLGPPPSAVPAQSAAVQLPNPPRSNPPDNNAENTKRIERSRARALPSVLRRLRLRLRSAPGLFNNGRVHRSASLRANTTLKVGPSHRLVIATPTNTKKPSPTSAATSAMTAAFSWRATEIKASPMADTAANTKEITTGTKPSHPPRLMPAA